MTDKINGGFRPGVWVEQEVRFVTVTFSATVAAAAGPQPNSPVDKALRWLSQYGTILGTSAVQSGTKLDVILGYAANVSAATNTPIIGTGVVVTGVADNGAATAAITAEFELQEFTLADVPATMALGAGGRYVPVTDYQS